MSDSNEYECADCGGPLRAGGMLPGLMMRCLHASGTSRYCGGARQVKPKLLQVRVFKCDRCRVKVKAPVDDDRPTCPTVRCTGDLVFVKLQTRLPSDQARRTDHTPRHRSGRSTHARTRRPDRPAPG